MDNRKENVEKREKNKKAAFGGLRKAPPGLKPLLIFPDLRTD
jgi:hypothetical protein